MCAIPQISKHALWWHLWVQRHIEGLRRVPDVSTERPIERPDRGMKFLDVTDRRCHVAAPVVIFSEATPPVMEQPSRSAAVRRMMGGSERAQFEREPTTEGEGTAMPHALQIDHDGHVALITLSAPPKNALDKAAIEELHAMLVDLGERDSTRVVVLSGAGGNFCAGRIRNMALKTPAEIATDLSPILAMNELLEAFPVPIIAAVEGAALGFGFGLATLCDVTVAAEDAVFALTELAHGIPPLIVLSYFFRFLPYKVGLDLALSGREVDANEAKRLGLLTTTCPSGSATEEAVAIARRIAAIDPEAIRLLRSFARGQAAILDAPAARDGATRIAALL